MSKKKRRPETLHAEIVEARVFEEREWAFARWLERRSWSTMRAMAIAPVDAGGLGRNLSVSALRTLVKEAREDRGDITMGRDERTERQSFEIDERIRAARDELAAATELGDVKRAAEADRRLAAAMRDERDLHGLDAAKRIEADVVTRDGVLEDLNAALLALGEAPIEKATP